MKTSTTVNTKPLKDAHPFDASSALLFAVLSIGAFAVAPYAHAQGASSNSNPPLTAPASNTARPAAAPGVGVTPPIPHTATTPSPALAPQLGGTAQQVQNSQAGVAFARADANRDGQLSPQEAVMLPAISQKFEALDRNKDKFLSLEEFALATKS
ncbi:EF-hand domain-containing protein [Acidovorax sp.]|uniref:EF-hand domain-containing protein n=1 Tax=Acidovorax sp. TaxID=1872122 RepID=UPI00391F9608